MKDFVKNSFSKIASVPLRYIVLLSLILKLGMFFYISPWDKKVESETILISDAGGYQNLALNILQNHSFAPAIDTVDVHKISAMQCTSYLGYHADTYRTPGYPAFLAVVYWIFGVKPYLAIFIQILLSLVSLLLVYKISILLFNDKSIATIAAFLLAIDIHSIYVSNLLLTDTLFTFFFIISIYYFLKGITETKIKSICIGAFFIGLACLTRPIVEICQWPYFV